jgi:anti-sigma factor RsiW
MRDCVRFAPMIGAREGELSADEVKALADHLVRCEQCQAVAADLAATDGLVSEGLLARANARDFGPFVDQVMARVYGKETEGAAALGWLHHHWKAVAATLVPALAALALFMYVRWDGRSEMALLELSSEGNVSTVLQTSDGPVVLLGDEDSGS